jgi:hypothetical protein
MRCTKIHDQAYLNACLAWDDACRNTVMSLDEQGQAVELCCEIVEERMLAHGSQNAPRSPLAFCYDPSCDGWAA